ncbi:hypothetical protein KCP73_15895 [Salmonella enterica subsp. enterica]|nr:hypothetical protein KCP73_15895 [Salmonella enterica subsp. enterica]
MSRHWAGIWKRCAFVVVGGGRLVASIRGKVRVASRMWRKISRLVVAYCRQADAQVAG